MHVIRHDDEFAKSVSLSIEVTQGGSYDFGVRLFAQKTRSISLIEEIIHFLAKALVKLDIRRLIPRLRVEREPDFALLVPLVEFCLGNGISEAPGHKHPCFILLPVRQFMPVAFDFPGGIEEDMERGFSTRCLAGGLL